MTEKQFKVINISKNGMRGLFKLGNDNLSVYDVARLLNELLEENEQLKKEKEIWKSDACSLSSLNSILSNELSIAQEQGYEPSKPYKEYIASIKTEYDKFWENKIKHMITD